MPEKELKSQRQGQPENPDAEQLRRSSCTDPPHEQPCQDENNDRTREDADNIIGTKLA